MNNVSDPLTKFKQAHVKKQIKTPLPDNFLTSDNTKQLIAQTIESIEQNCRNQQDIDVMYKMVCNVYYNVLQAYATRWLGTVAKWRYRHKPKPRWNNELSDLWDQLLKCENDFKSYRGARQVLRRLQENLKIAQRQFDKVYHKTKRIFHVDQQADLLTLNTRDPKQFLDKVNGLGPKC